MYRACNAAPQARDIAESVTGITAFILKSSITMPRLKHRKIYEDDGQEMLEGSKVLVNGKFVRILHFDEIGEIAVSDWPDIGTIETIERFPDDRYGGIEDDLIGG